jgi:hypothetical protein
VPGALVGKDWWDTPMDNGGSAETAFGKDDVLREAKFVKRSVT